ncbi:serine threonine dehydratase, putative [Babesia ovata]|uniref:Serine threonine dehydratase, putative n=1 Tax=Babesia ovata TaxID=189622 RepID=A0A2H6KJK3_9APIC|nr:serine threonine dehydratase, putative [Babesia ovata]GBE63161.1 serine threonine dehydratase, putative [Babesia ovata]
MARRLALKHTAKLALDFTVHVIVLEAGSPLEHVIDVTRRSWLWWDVVVRDTVVLLKEVVAQVEDVDESNLVVAILDFNFNFGSVKFMLNQFSLNLFTRHAPLQVTILLLVIFRHCEAAGVEPEGHHIFLSGRINLFLTPLTAAVPLQTIHVCHPTRETGEENLRQLLAVVRQFAFVV